MPRLTKGAREAIEQIELDFALAFKALNKANYWTARREPEDVASELLALEQLMRKIKARILDDIEPMLQRRADNQPTLEDRLKSVEESLQDALDRIDELENGRVLKLETERSRHGHST